MKLLFSVILAVLVLMSVVAWRMIPPAPGGDRITLVWATDNNPVRQAQVDLFNKLNPDVYLMIDPANTGAEKVIVQSLGGVGPDLFDSYGIGSLETYVNAGIAWDVTEQFKEEGIELDKLIWPVAVPSCVLEGRVYATPCNVNAQAIWYNKDVFDRYGVPYPRQDWTWDELIETAQKLTKRDARGNPTVFGLYWGFDAWVDLAYQHGGDVFVDGGTRCVVDSPETIAGIQLGHDLLYKYKIAPTPVEEATLATAGGWGSGGMTFLMDGRVAMAWGGRWWLNRMRQQKGLRLGAVELPYAKEKTLLGGARVAMINSRSPKREVALRFLKFLLSPEYNILLNDQADALAPLKSVAYTPRFLLNPDYPQEDYNEVWRNAVSRSQPDQVSPFVKGADLTDLNRQVDLVKGDLKPPPDAMRDAARDVNARILRNARLKPHLGALYEEITGRQPQ
jgi:multiple sugar transport system substrate-binding protein